MTELEELEDEINKKLSSTQELKKFNVSGVSLISLEKIRVEVAAFYEREKALPISMSIYIVKSFF